MKKTGLFGEHLSRMVTVKNLQTGELYEFDANQGKKDPHFYISLPPGSYEITRIEAGNISSSHRWYFQVGKNKVQNIGALMFKGGSMGSAMLTSILSGRSTFSGKWVLGDGYDTAVKYFRATHPRVKGSVIKAFVKKRR